MKDILNFIQEGFKAEENMVTYTGNKSCYAIINTSEYNAPDVAVMIEEINKLGDIGFDKDEIKEIKKLEVGKSLDEFKEAGVVVVRLK